MLCKPTLRRYISKEVIVVDSLFIVAPIVCGGFLFGLLFCYAVLIVSFLVLQTFRKRGREWLLYFNCLCVCVAVSVLDLFIMMSWCVIVALPGVDPGFLERGFICIKVWGSFCWFYLISLKYPMKWINLVSLRYFIGYLKMGGGRERRGFKWTPWTPSGSATDFLVILTKIKFLKKIFQKHYQSGNSLDPDQDPHYDEADVIGKYNLIFLVKKRSEMPSVDCT